MTERSEDEVDLLAPESGGEPLADYIRRVIVEDPILAKYRKTAQTFPPQLFRGPTRFFRNRTEHGPAVDAFPIAVWPHFTPAHFSLPKVIAGHDGLDRVRLGISERTAKRLDGIWDGRGFGGLDVLMSRQPRHDLGAELPRRHDLGAGDALPVNDPPPDPYLAFLAETEPKVLKNWRAGARRRDVLVATLCDAWRSGAILLRGFRADDFKRRLVEIPAAWLSDPWLSCWWQQDELRPLDGAAPGTPHFRGLAARQVAAAASGRRERSLEVIEPAFLAWASGEQVVTKRVAEKWAEGQGFSVQVVRDLHSKHLAAKQEENQTIAGEQWAKKRS
jgi:hypothetical protein